jgi:hypothetical protein
VGTLYDSVSDAVGGHNGFDGKYRLANMVWKTRNTDAATANMLVFSTDKEKYAVGENAQISFHPVQERAFISIENGSKVVQTFGRRPKRRN